MPDTLAELGLSPVYRHAQRSLALWLDNEQGMARQLAFRARQALAALDATERHHLARWLAWLTVATQSRGQDDPSPRIGRLDNSLHQLVTDARAKLPALTGDTRAVMHRRSA